ncbi:hypothetical protein C8J55DRAFT_123907 [Lentinula edodes]|uniref:Uncharacterized protein n=1 Tax=Lentinula lateritia TaxID=40482 RepID=A0A9W9A5R6_9AGAR|nr:hypothetical protein C8J55DRAFT_123907 [Lentinula edodes]
MAPCIYLSIYLILMLLFFCSLLMRRSITSWTTIINMVSRRMIFVHHSEESGVIICTPRLRSMMSSPSICTIFYLALHETHRYR